MLFGRERLLEPFTDLSIVRCHGDFTLARIVREDLDEIVENA